MAVGVALLALGAWVVIVLRPAVASVTWWGSLAAMVTGGVTVVYFFARVSFSA